MLRGIQLQWSSFTTGLAGWEGVVSILLQPVLNFFMARWLDLKGSAPCVGPSLTSSGTIFSHLVQISISSLGIQSGKPSVQFWTRALLGLPSLLFSPCLPLTYLLFVLVGDYLDIGGLGDWGSVLGGGLWRCICGLGALWWLGSMHLGVCWAAHQALLEIDG